MEMPYVAAPDDRRALTVGSASGHAPYTEEAPDVVRGRCQGRFVHAEGTSLHTVSGGWIGLWRRKTGLPGEVCSFQNCVSRGNDNVMLGAHVRWSGSTARYGSWWIVPACVSCNNKRGLAGRLKPGTWLVKVMDGRMFRPNQLLAGKLEREKRCLRQRFWRPPAKDHPPEMRVWPDDWWGCGCGCFFRG